MDIYYISELMQDVGEKQSLSEERHLTRRECKINFGVDIALL